MISGMKQTPLQAQCQMKQQDSFLQITHRKWAISWFGSAATTKHLSHPVTYYPKTALLINIFILSTVIYWHPVLWWDNSPMCACLQCFQRHVCEKILYPLPLLQDINRKEIEQKKHKMNKQSKTRHEKKCWSENMASFYSMVWNEHPPTVKCEHDVGNFAY